MHLSSHISHNLKSKDIVSTFTLKQSSFRTKCGHDIQGQSNSAIALESIYLVLFAA